MVLTFILSLIGLVYASFKDYSEGNQEGWVRKLFKNKRINTVILSFVLIASGWKTFDDATSQDSNDKNLAQLVKSHKDDSILASIRYAAIRDTLSAINAALKKRHMKFNFATNQFTTYYIAPTKIEMQAIKEKEEYQQKMDSIHNAEEKARQAEVIRLDNVRQQQLSLWLNRLKTANQVLGVDSEQTVALLKKINKKGQSSDIVYGAKTQLTNVHTKQIRDRAVVKNYTDSVNHYRK